MLRINDFYYSYYFFITLISIHISTFGSMTEQKIKIPKTPEYKELKNKFTKNALKIALQTYQVGWYNNNPVFQKWSPIADSVIGRYSVEEQRRYFLVSVMLHNTDNAQGLNVIYDHIHSALSSERKQQRTPNGLISTLLSAQEYESAMDIPLDIRSKVFDNKVFDKKHSPLVLVEKSFEVNPDIKWSLLKVGGALFYIFVSYLKKEDTEKEPYKKKGDSLPGFLALSDQFNKMENDLRENMEKQFPALKTHAVKSLIRDKTWLSYAKENWIFCGSVSCMMVLLLCLLHDKIPYLHRPPTVIVAAVIL